MKKNKLNRINISLFLINIMFVAFAENKENAFARDEYINEDTRESLINSNNEISRDKKALEELKKDLIINSDEESNKANILNKIESLEKNLEIENENFNAVRTSEKNKKEPAIFINMQEITLRSLIDICFPEKNIIYKLDLPDSTFSIKEDVVIPKANAVNFVNSILKHFGASVNEDENDGTLSVNGFAVSDEIPKAVVSLSSDLSLLQKGKVLVIASLHKDDIKLFVETIEKKLKVSVDSINSKMIVFTCSSQDAKISQKILEAISLSKDSACVETISLKRLPPEKVKHILVSLTGSNSAKNKVFVIPNIKTNSVMLAGAKHNVNLFKIELIKVDEELSKVDGKISTMTYYRKKLSPEKISKLLEVNFGLQPSQIISSESSREMIFIASSETLNEIRALLERHDLMPKSVSVEYIILETSKLKDDSFDNSPVEDKGNNALENIVQGAVTGFFTASKFNFDSKNAISSLIGYIRLGSLSTIRNTKIKSIQCIEVTDGETGVLSYGTEISISSGNEEDSSKKLRSLMSRQEYGIKLKVTPRVIDDNYLFMDISSKLENFLNGVNTTPEVKKRSIDVKNALLRNGRLSTIGKIDHSEISNTENYSSRNQNVLMFIFNKLVSLLMFSHNKQNCNETMITITVVPRF